MTVSIILTSHMKPTLGEAIESVLAQTRQDFDCVVMDSGAWLGGEDERSVQMRSIYEGLRGRNVNLSVHLTDEPPDLRGSRCPVSWATNEAIRRGLVRGEYVCHFYDDDVYYPQFIERMAGYLDANPEAGAVWCSQDRLTLTRAGETQQHGHIAADRIAMPGSIDCRVDGAQVMYRRELLDVLGDPWMDENPATCGHSDGLFLERLAFVSGGLHPLGETLLAHRNTPYSTYSPS